MLFKSREVRPGPSQRRVVNEYGVVEAVPAGWDLLVPGDAALSRRIKLDGPSLTVIEMKGRKRFSRGIWAPADRIAALRAARAAELQDPSHQKNLEAGRRRARATRRPTPPHSAARSSGTSISTRITKPRGRCSRT